MNGGTAWPSGVSSQLKPSRRQKSREDCNSGNRCAPLGSCALFHTFLCSELVLIRPDDEIPEE